MVQTLARKLAIKPGMRLRLIGAPDTYIEMLGTLPEGTLLAEDEGPYDAIHLFVRDRADLERDVPGAIAALLPGGLLWIAYPKGGSGVPSDLNRDKLRAGMEPTGWRPVTQIAIDEVWSALRFRPVADVGT